MKTLTVRQQEVLQFITDFKSDKKISPTIREIASNFKISVRGAYDHIRALEKKGRISCNKNLSRSIIVLSELKEKGDLLTVPVLGRVAAGRPLFAEENVEGEVDLPSDIHRNRDIFALRVYGDSMTGAGIMDGDIAIINKQADAETGQIVVALLEESATLKRLIKEKNRVRLQAENPAYSPIFSRNVQILGRLIYLIRAYD